jgi:hypothetical protein
VADEQQQEAPEQQGPSYPYFPMTAAGLAQIHQEAGRLLHQTIEVSLLDAKKDALLSQLRRQIVKFRAGHLDGKCAPVQQGEAQGDVIDAEPTPIVGSKERRRGTG